MFLLSRFFRKKDERIGRLANVIGFYPKNQELFKTAVRHSSVIYTQKVDLASNERLEFLGDAVLELIISEILFEKFPGQDEGQLTKLRIKLVNRGFLNGRAIEMGLPSILHQYVGKKNQLKQENHSIFGNALEALIGAVYLEKGYKGARIFVEKKILGDEEYFNDVLGTKVDFKSQLLSWSQRNQNTVEFVEIASDDPDSFKVCVKIGDKFYGKGTGRRKKYAHQKAAQKTIEILTDENTW